MARSIPLLTLLRPLTAALLVCPALAQTPLSGPLSDTTTGPLTPGVYHATAAISVPLGETLTVQSGAVVKFNGTLFQVDGTLNAGAAVFTSIHDDTAGGDTNANGAATVGAAGQWSGIYFTTASDASVLNGADIRFAGSGGWTGLYLSSADITVTGCIVRDSSNVGLNALNTSFPTVSGTAFTNNAGIAVTNLLFDGVAGFTNNTASGNAGNYIQVTGGSLSSNASLGASHCLGGALVATANLTVPDGITLTLGPDFVLKSTGGQLTVHGTLDANGSSGSPVVMTAFADDDHGGDTNNDGSSSGAPGAWQGIYFTNSSDASHLDWTISRYGGSGGWAPVYLAAADITLTNCTLSESSNDGLQVNGNSYPTVSGCTFSNNAGIAIDTLTMDGVPLLSNNTAAGNAAGDFVRVTVTHPTGSMSILKDNYPGPVLVVNTTSSIPVGSTFTIEEGVILKFGNGQLSVGGTLSAVGTAGEPIVFTTFDDDDWGGDTFKNGATSGAPGAWQGLSFQSASDASVLEHAVVRYGGQGGFSNAYLNNADITMSNCTLSEALGAPMNLTNTSEPTVSNCTLADSGGVAVASARMDGVPQLTNNTASGNAGGNYVQVTVPSPTADLTIAPVNLMGDALVVMSTCTIPTGVTMTLDAGVVLKFSNGSLTTSGTLLSSGTETQQVAITHFSDDDWAGDTNLDGPSNGSPGVWQGLTFNTTSDASVLEHTVVRYGGQGGFSNLYLLGADISIEDCSSTECATSGMDLNNGSRPTVRASDFSDNAAFAVIDAEVEALQGFSLNTGTNNGTGDYIQVIDLSTTEQVTIEPHMLIGPLVTGVAGSIGTGGRLTLAAGVVVKLGGGQLTAGTGALECLGTRLNPVVITTLPDDTVLGDTNKNGPSTGIAGSWPGVHLTSSSQPSILRNTVVRFGGQSGWNAIECNSASAVLEGVRSDWSLTRGIELDLVSSATRLSAWNCASDGVRATAGSFDVSHVSAVGNGGAGIRREPAYAGAVVSSIAWNNTGGNYSGFVGSGDLRYSNGDTTLAGSDGNINSDPFFVDELNGDLNLLAGSPSIGAGDPALGLDPDCTAPDQGAYFLDQTGDSPATYCTAKVNSKGCTPYVDFLGFASASSPAAFELTGNDVVNNKNGLFFYGTAPHNGTFQGGTKCVLSPVKRTPVQDSGGNPAPDDCSGTYLIDFNAYIQSGANPALIPGLKVYGQFWGRDPKAPFTTQLTDGASFTICP